MITSICTEKVPPFLADFQTSPVPLKKTEDPGALWSDFSPRKMENFQNWLTQKFI